MENLTEDQIATIVFATCKRILDDLGPGLLEKTYERILVYELNKQGLNAVPQVSLPIEYDGLCLDDAYRLDILVEDKVILELKAVEKIVPLHKAQLLTYLKLTGKKLGLLINFDTEYMGGGFKRVVNGLEED